MDVKADKSELDGEWVFLEINASRKLADVKGIFEGEVDLSQIIPQDGHYYKCLFQAEALVAGGIQYVWVSSKKGVAQTTITGLYNISPSQNKINTWGSAEAIVAPDRKLYFGTSPSANANSEVRICICGFKKLGKH